RVVFILKKEGVKMPAWVKDTAKKEGKLRHADKLRRNQPKEELKTEEPATEESAEASADADTPAEAVTEKAEE
ncbi:MAG: hypothetical protein WBO35_05130, partial [Candidatus Saccharimonadales bacterium]